MRPALLFAAIGPNPASVSEAIDALYARGLCVVEAHLVSLEGGHLWLADELLGADGIVSELRDALPGVLPKGDGSIYERVATGNGPGTATGNLLTDDSTDEAAAAYRAAIWDHARACLDRAGDARPVIFLLAGGRMRTITAYTTTMYQLLARASDELFDVRVSDRRVEGGTGFFFPGQRQKHLLIDGEMIDAAAVQVHLVPVGVPRLAGLLQPAHLASYETALAASHRAIEAVTPPTLVIDFAKGEARVNDELVPFTAAQLCWYGLLAAKRVADASQPDAPQGQIASDAPQGQVPSDAPQGQVPSDAVELVQALLAPIAREPWVQKVRDFTMRQALGLSPLHSTKSASQLEPERLGKLRADTARVVSKWLESALRPAWAPLLVPHKEKAGGANHQRLALAPALITLRWPAS